MVTSDDRAWVLLTYRLPREPSGPRLALWRAIRRLGALQLGDGLVALPTSVRNLEHVQWMASDIVERGGTATVWHARTDTRRDHDAQVAAMRASTDEEFRAVLEEARAVDVEGLPSTERRRMVRRLRGQLRRIGLRDHYAAPSGPQAREAVDDLARVEDAVIA
jgi:hypothetical protein